MNLALPLNILYGHSLFRLDQISHYAKTMNMTQTHFIHTYNNKGYKDTDMHL